MFKFGVSLSYIFKDRATPIKKVGLGHRLPPPRFITTETGCHPYADTPPFCNSRLL